MCLFFIIIIGIKYHASGILNHLLLHIWIVFFFVLAGLGDKLLALMSAPPVGSG